MILNRKFIRRSCCIRLNQYLKNEGLSQYPIHIELETGMNRLGFSKDELPELLSKLQSHLFKVQSVFSHLVASEDPDLDYFTMQQAELFRQMSNAIKEKLSYPFLRHLLNTSGISRHPSLQFDMVRMGIGLYGIDSANVLELKEVSTLKIVCCADQTFATGRVGELWQIGTVNRETWIATVRLGYADGYPRILGNGRGHMLVNNKLAPTIGNICMDMTMIDITGILDIHEGDEVTVFGKGLPVSDVAKWAETIPYEILTGISQRVKRVYFQE